MFSWMLYTTSRGKEIPLYKFSKRELYRAYVSILSSLDGCGEYEPIAFGIRSVWSMRRYKMKKLWALESRFKQLKRRDIKKVNKILKFFVDMIR